MPPFKHNQRVIVETREGPRQARFVGYSNHESVHLRLLDLLGNETGRQITTHQKWVKSEGSESSYSPRAESAVYRLLQALEQLGDNASAEQRFGVMAQHFDKEMLAAARDANAILAMRDLYERGHS